jgi:glycosyltransferase involved in cell wall biosynthesis
MYKVAILTKNEELNIEACLKSLFVKDVIIVDSNSNDNTIKIIEQIDGLEKIILLREFDDFGSQRNYALSHLGDDEFVLFLDADERMTRALHEEIIELVKKSEDVVYSTAHDNRCSRLLPIQYIRENRTFQVRFGKVRNLNYTGFGHGQKFIGNLKIKKIHNKLIHLPFSKGLDDWLEKHWLYANHESQLGEKKHYNFLFFPEIILFYDLIFGLGLFGGKRTWVFLLLKYHYFNLIRIKRYGIL